MKEGEQTTDQDVERKAIKTSIRFEVFKRDSFTCQYCGGKAPDILLHVDHIHPVSKGGNNDILNLITSCSQCNSGKSDRLLNDTTVIDKRHKQLAELQERKQQIDLMFQWQQSLVDVDMQVLDKMEDLWFSLTGFYLTDSGRRNIQRHIKQFSIERVISSLKAAAETYIKNDASGDPTIDSSNHALAMVQRICYVSRLEETKPHMRDVFYIRGILKNRLGSIDKREAKELLDEAIQGGAPVGDLRVHAMNATDWGEWKQEMRSGINDIEEERMAC